MNSTRNRGLTATAEAMPPSGLKQHNFKTYSSNYLWKVVSNMLKTERAMPKDPCGRFGMARLRLDTRKRESRVGTAWRQSIPERCGSDFGATEKAASTRTDRGCLNGRFLHNFLAAEEA